MSFGSIAFKIDTWPFSYYPMFSQPKDLQEVMQFKITLITNDSQEIALPFRGNIGNTATLKKIYEIKDAAKFLKLLRSKYSHVNWDEMESAVLYRVKRLATGHQSSKEIMRVAI